MLCWMNGKYERSGKLKISPFDHGFLYGLGFFETFRTYESLPFLFDAHMNRLKSALKEYHISFPYHDEELLKVIKQLNDEANGRDGYFRLNVSAGVHDIGLGPTVYSEPNVIMFRKELPVQKENFSKKGIWLKTVRNSPESGIRHKSHHFSNNIKGRLELDSLQETEGIFLTKDGYVAEGITSNIFWVVKDTLYTPSVDTGILPGTTRAFIMQLAKKLSINIEEGFFSKSFVESASEVFVTNAIQELVPLHQLGGGEFLGIDGPVFQQLKKSYQQAIIERRA